MTMKWRPWCSPMSCTEQTCGWFSPEAARASRPNRSTASGSRDNSLDRNLSATVRPSRVSVAL